MKNVLRFVQFVAQFITLGLALAFVVTLFAPHFVDRLRGAHKTKASSSAPATSTANGTAGDTPDGGTVAVAPTAEPPATVPGFGPAAPDVRGSNPAAGNIFTRAREASTAARERSDDTITASYSKAVVRAAPAVVSIVADRMGAFEQQVLVPKDPRLRTLIPPIPYGAPYQQKRPDLGSGVIINAEGYVLTNNHVIAGADNIRAVLSTGQTAHAKVVGSDPETDLAVLRLDTGNLPALPIADQPPAVGDVVLAIGSPFGLGNTVTMGIVSAVGRVNPATAEEFIQTDAAINAGNSGGALVNAYGELVGINSNNYSPSGGGSIGIGFAIPVSTVTDVLDQILKHGRVIRGWLGATYANPTTPLNPSLPQITAGVRIAALTADGPAAHAGLQVNDIVTSFDGRSVANQYALRLRESRAVPGSLVKVAGVRDGHPFLLDVTLGEKPTALAPGNAETTAAATQ